MTGKPLGPKGQYCPLVKRDCGHAKACQSCVFWRPLDVTRGGVTKAEWDCAFAWPVMTQGVLNARLDAMAQSIQGMRNQFAEMKETMGHLLAGVLSAASRRLEAPAPLRLLETRDPMQPPYQVTCQNDDGEEQRSNQS